MQDRVEYIQFRITRRGVVDREFECHVVNTAFEFDALNGVAKLTPKIDLASLEYGQRYVADFLNSIEADFLFQTNPPRREFDFDGGRMRSGETVYTLLRGTVNVVGPQAEANHRVQYPWRHHDFENDPLISALFERYQAYREGKELLSVLGYFCLSALERAAGGGRKNFCRTFSISPDVADKVGELTSAIGTFHTARKIDRKHELRDLADDEQFWLAAAIRVIVRRAGEVRAGLTPTSEVTMRDLQGS